MLCADTLSTAVSDRDYRQFWNKVHKTNNGRATKYSDTFHRCVGDSAIVERWREHFEKLYNSVDDSKHISQFNARLASVLSD